MDTKKYILTLSCKDRVGIVAAVTGALAEESLFILELSQYSDPTTGQFFMRIFFKPTKEIPEETVHRIFTQVGKRFDMRWNLHSEDFRPKVLLMVSKLSHCFNDLLHRMFQGSLPIDIVAAVSNHPDLEEIARWHKVPFTYLPVTSDNKQEQEQKLLQIIEDKQVNLIVLARYMQVLSDHICSKLSGRIINIHHSFLPSFKGAKPYHQAFDRGVKIIGATAHYVTADLDEGPIIDQETIHVHHDQRPADLVQIGQDIECRVLARAVKWHVENRVMLNGKKTVIFNR
ncbi:MAG: formyltetrahydrofolate deformylase [Chlamydiia bacterium]|nr:formyltetrahydrofolate deformylase [Chlamydiia bacterium]